MKVFDIDMSHICGYVDGEEDKVIRKALRKQELLNKRCLYSIFNGERTEQVKKTGNYRMPKLDSIFAFQKHELFWETDMTPNSIKTHLQDYDPPGIVVYDRQKFYQDFKKGTHWEYFFKDLQNKPKAVLGIGLMRF